MKNLKRIIAALLATLSMFVVTVSAEELLIAPAAKGAAGDVNGIAIQAPDLLKTEQGLFIPLRAVCESLGYTVTWHSATERIEITKLPIYITCTPRQDGYTFAKTAPMLLGTAPRLIDGVTYVPISFVEKILQSSYTIGTDDTVYISDRDMLPEVAVSIVEKGDGYIVVDDLFLGHVLLYADEHTIITDATGNQLTLEGLREDRTLLVQYGEVMTLSLPPATTAVQIIQLEQIAHSTVQGSICELVYAEEALTGIIVGDPADYTGQTALHIAADTELMDTTGNKIDVTALKKGMTVHAWASIVTTNSLPAQRFAEKVVLVS